MDNKSFLDYYKTILRKVSFDPVLVQKEYLKAINTLHPTEVKDFNRWVGEAGLKSKIKEAKQMQISA